ncbi:MAG: hypothetical protein AAF570_01040 [Bacteroidota bacterium]
MNRPPVSHRNWVLLLLAGHLVLVAATFFPIPFWGLHALHYLPYPVQAVLLGLPLALGIWAWRQQKGLPLEESGGKEGRGRLWGLAAGLGLLMLVPLLALQVETLMYGDAREVLRTLESGDGPHMGASLLSAFSPDVFSVWNGEQFSYQLAGGLGDMTGGEVAGVWRGLSVFWGVVFCMLWTWHVLKTVQTPLWRVSMVMMGLCAGFMGVFFGHLEVYAAPVTAFAAVMVAMLEYLRKRSEEGKKAGMGGEIVLLILTFLAIRTHTAGFALLPVVLWALLWGNKEEVGGLGKWLDLRGMLYFGGILLLAGLGLYFGMYEAGTDPNPEAGAAGRNLFLPLGPDGSAAGDYTLFSLAHLLDYFNLILFWSLPGLLLLLGILIGHRKAIDWKDPAILVTGLAFFCFFALFFAIDPKLSMPRDWDLMSLPGVFLLFFALTCFTKIPAAHRPPPLVAAALLGFALVQAAQFYINADHNAVHRRLLDQGKHIFTTYHGGAGFMIRHSLDEMDAPATEKTQTLRDLLNELSPAANPGNDREFAYLAQSTAFFYFEAKDFKQSANFYRMAHSYRPDDHTLATDAAVSYMNLGKAADALKWAQKALKSKSDHPKALKVAMYAAWQIGNFPAAAQHGSNYLRLAPNDAAAQNDFQAITAGQPPAR